MRTTFKLVKALAVLSALLPLCALGQTGTIIYDNSAPTSDLNRTYGLNGTEFGDQITFAAGVSNPVIDDFKFEYFLSGNATGNETVQLFLRDMDGPNITVTRPDGSTATIPSPGTVIYTSPVLTLQAGFNTAEASQFLAPVTGSSITWSVVFSNVGAGVTAGLSVYDPVSVGSSFSDFWQKNGGTWNTEVFADGTPANFAARVTAVPEPTTLAFGLLAGLAWFGFRGFKRRE